MSVRRASGCELQCYSKANPLATLQMISVFTNSKNSIIEIVWFQEFVIIGSAYGCAISTQKTIHRETEVISSSRYG